MKKLKKWTPILLATSLSLMLVGCNSSAPTEEGSTAQADSTTKAPVLEDKLIIYSTHPEDLLEVVAEDFEALTGVEVDFINLKGELADKILAEKNNPQADIMYGGASSLFMDLADQDVFEVTTPSWANDLDALFKDTDNRWFGTIQTPVMMFYNSEMLTEAEAPKDWSDLANPSYKDQLVFRDAGSSSAKAMYASLLYQYDKDGQLEEGWNYLKALDSNTKKYYSSGSLQFQAIGRKEASISFAVLNSIIDNKNNGLPLEIVDATSGSPVITDGIAMIKNAPHKEAAKAFLEFAGSAEVQAKLANEFDRMPTLKEALENSPSWMNEANYKVMDVDWKVLAQNQSAWMQKWDTEIKDATKQAQE